MITLLEAGLMKHGEWRIANGHSGNRPRAGVDDE